MAPLWDEYTAMCTNGEERKRRGINLTWCANLIAKKGEIVLFHCFPTDTISSLFLSIAKAYIFLNQMHICILLMFTCNKKSYIVASSLYLVKVAKSREISSHHLKTAKGRVFS